MTVENATPLPTSFQRVDDSNESVEEGEVILKFNTLLSKHATFIIDFIYDNIWVMFPFKC